jgi:hypothetical protein
LDPEIRFLSIVLHAEDHLFLFKASSA